MRKILSIIALFVAAVAMGQVKKLHLQASNLQWEAKKVVGAGITKIGRASCRERV